MKTRSKHLDCVQSESNKTVNLGDSKGSLNSSIGKRTVLQTRSKKNDCISTFVPTVNKAKKKSPSEEESKKKESKKQLVEFGDYRVFVVGDIVWTKLKGWQSWPSKACVLLSY